MIEGTEMFFNRHDRDDEHYEDPATRYGRLVRKSKEDREEKREKPSLLARIFGSGHDSDFVYHED